MIDKELNRLAVQAELDAAKTQLARNRLGQFATPTVLALDIVRYADHLLAGAPVRFLEPAMGTGAFYSALLRTIDDERIKSAVGYEVDGHYGHPARQLWASTQLDLRIADFTQAVAPSMDPERFNLVISNPPYVRHHHMTSEQKVTLQRQSESAAGVKLGGLSGLYCHFMMLCHAWMADGAVGCWLIPSEFMDVNYGAAVKQYLLEKVTLTRIHRFAPDDVQFGDALVSSAVVWFRKSNAPAEHTVEFSYGGTHGAPTISKFVSVVDLRKEAKWTRFPLSDTRVKGTGPTLADFFAIKRGIATGDNGFFIVSESTAKQHGLPPKYLRPILPSPRYLDTDIVEGDADGVPINTRRQFLIDCSLPESELAATEPALWKYLEAGKPTVATGYLCSKRAPWYAQEDRPAPAILCTYMGRGDPTVGRPFRFIRNKSRATAANVFLLLYPKPTLARAITRTPDLLEQTWAWLNTIDTKTLLGEGRVYGGGLYKLEPKELANVPASWLANLADDSHTTSPF